MAMIKLKSSDGDVIEVEKKVASMSRTIMHLLSDEANKNGEVIPIASADSDTLRTVVAYCQKHSSKAEPEDLNAWDEGFKEQIDSFPKLFKLINASDYLDLQDLLELTIQKAVEMMEDLSVKEVRELFMLPKDDFKADEEAEIRKRFAWAFEDKDVACSVQSLRLISNLVGARDKIICALLDFTDALVGMKSSQFNNILPKVVGWEEEGTGRILCEACSCIPTMLSRVAEDLKTSTPDSTSKQILEHANMSRIVDHLCLCLASSGSSLASCSSHMLAAACEACRAIRILVDTSETFFKNDNAYIFPLDALEIHRHSLLDQWNSE